MEKIIFFSLVILIFAFVLYLGVNAIMKGMSAKNAKALTPVPGGVGPMTIACLLKNTIDCFKRSQV